MRCAVAACQLVDAIRTSRWEDGVAALVGVESRRRHSWSPLRCVKGIVAQAIATNGICRVLRMIEQVEEIELELHLHPFGDLEVLSQGQVHVAVAGALADAHSGVAKLANLQPVYGEGIGIEPLPSVAAATPPAGLARDEIRPLPTAVSDTRKIVPDDRRHGRTGGEVDD